MLWQTFAMLWQTLAIVGLWPKAVLKFQQGRTCSIALGSGGPSPSSFKEK